MLAPKKNYVLSTAGLAAAVMLSLSACGDGTTEAGMSRSVTASAPSTVLAEADSITDTSDIRNLMALATHVFTGQVQAASGSKALGPIPETQFTVNTAISLKGQVGKTVTVNQQGGMAEGVYVSVGGDKPLEVGRWYRFAARYLESERWYTVIPVHGDVEVSEQEAREKSSEPITAAVEALQDNPQGRLDLPPTTPPSPTLTFPIPTPGEENPPPPSAPQPTR